MTQHKDLIDTALAHRSDKERARVLDLVRKMGVSQEDDFWLIFIAIGQLQVLVEDTPVQWQAIFDDFKEYLGQWSDKNIELMTLLDTQNQGIAMLAEDIQYLQTVSGENSQRLIASFNELATLLATLGKVSNDSEQHVAHLTTSVQQLQQQNSQLLTQMSTMAKEMTAIRTTLNTPHRTSWWIPWGIGAMLFMSVITSIGLANAHDRLDRAAAPKPPSDVMQRGWITDPP